MAITPYGSPVRLESAAAGQTIITIPAPPANALVVLPLSIYVPDALKYFVVSDQYNNPWNVVLQDQHPEGSQNWRQAILYVYNASSTPGDWNVVIDTNDATVVSVEGVAQVFAGVRFNANPLVSRSTGAIANGEQSITVVSDNPPIVAGSLAVAVVGVEQYSDFAIQNAAGWTSLASNNVWDYPNKHPFRAAYLLTGTGAPSATFNLTNAAGNAPATGIVVTALMLVFDPAPATGPQPTATSPTVTVSTNDAGASGGFTATGTPTVTCAVVDANNNVVVSQSPQITGSSYTTQFTNLPGGVFTVRTTVTDVNGAANASSASFEIVGLQSTADIDPTYLVTALRISPAPAYARSGITKKVYISDQEGFAVQGATVTSGTTGTATVTTPAGSDGSVDVTTVANGTTTLTASIVNDSGATITTTGLLTVSAGAPIVPTIAVGSPTASTLPVTVTDANSGTASHEIEVAEAADGPWESALTLPIGTLSGTITGLLSAIQYRVRVVAVKDGQRSLPSAVVTGTTLAAADSVAPTVSLSADRTTIVGAGSVIFTVTANDNVRVAVVRLFRGSTQIGTDAAYPSPASPVVIPVPFTSALADGTYTFQAEAEDTSGNLSSRSSVDIAWSVGVPIPAVPSQPTASNITSSAALLTTPLVAGATAYRWQYRLGAGAWTTVDQDAPGSGTVATLSLSGLTANSGYEVKVAAGNVTGYSNYSTARSFSTLTATGTPIDTITKSVAEIIGNVGGAANVTFTVTAGGSPKAGVSVTMASSDFASPSAQTVTTNGSGQATFTVGLSAEGTATHAVTANDGLATVTLNPAFSVTVLPIVTSELLKAIRDSMVNPKYDNETVPYVFDFNQMLGKMESLDDPPLSVTCVPTGGQQQDEASAAMIVGSPTVVGRYVIQYFRGGLPGLAYFLRCQCTTSLNRTVTAELRLSVYQTSGNRIDTPSPVV